MATINFAYPSTRRRNPFQSVPRPAHNPSSSISSIASSASGTCASHSTCTSQDIVARILAQDEIPRGTFLASEAQKKKQTHPKDYPERTDSRRALLSVFNGSKAPFVFKGPSFGTPPSNDIPAIPSLSNATPYLHKELPPTPHTAASILPSALPTIRPLNLSPKRSPPLHQSKSTTAPTLASKRLSRAIRAVPAPIRPPPRIGGFAALNGPCSANTSDEEDMEAPIAGTTRVPSEEAAGDLPITPLDIPVDWDDLHECWTSPVLYDGKQEEETTGLEMALQTFQQEVAGLFAASPLESMESRECSSDDTKRHGRMLVTKQLKLCMDVNVQFDKRHKSHRASSGPQFKAGESFLMMSSPLTPCNASAGLRTSSILDAYAYVS